MKKKKQTPPKRFQSRPQVVKRVGLSRFTLARMEEAGTFPKSFKNGKVRKAYNETDIDDWMVCQILGVKWPR